MNILKRVLLILVTPLFSLLLFATAVDWGFVHVASHPATVEKLVADSGVYNNIIPSLLKQTGHIDTIPLNNPDVIAIAKQSFSADMLKAQTDMAIDNTYAWLDGKTGQPNFTIDLTGQLNQFAKSVGQLEANKAASLPSCPASATWEGNYDALNATCLPPGITPDILATSTSGVLYNGFGNEQVLSNPIITSGDLKSSGSNQSIFADQLKDAPKQYQRAKKTPYLLALLTVLTGAAIVLLSSTWQRGIKHLGITLLVVGLLMLAFAWTLDNEVATKLVPKIKIDTNSVLQANVRKLATDLVAAIDKNYWFFGGLYAVLGTSALGWLWYTRRQAVEPAKISSKPKPTDDLG